jgi:hypothetical protein
MTSTEEQYFRINLGVLMVKALDPGTNTQSKNHKY